MSRRNCSRRISDRQVAVLLFRHLCLGLRQLQTRLFRLPLAFPTEIVRAYAGKELAAASGTGIAAKLIEIMNRHVGWPFRACRSGC